MISREAYGSAYDAGYRKTIGFLMSRGISPIDAEEAAQAAWAKGWTKRDQLRNPESITEWVNSIAFNQYRAEFSRNNNCSGNYILEGQGRDHDLDSRIMAKKMRTLSRESDWQVLRRHYILGYTTKEIGNMDGSTVPAVKIQLLRARRRVRKKAESANYAR